jgi:hypothetical protein
MNSDLGILDKNYSNRGSLNAFQNTAPHSQFASSGIY